MAPNRPSSPTSLLWAHQLKREHGFLLDRIKKLEAVITKIDSTAQAALNANAGHDVAGIAAKVQALTDGFSSEVAEALRKEVMGHLKDVSTGMEAIVLKVAAMDKTNEKLEEDRRKAFSNEKALLKRAKELEGRLREHEQNLEKLGSQVEASTMDKIRGKLNEVTNKVRSDSMDVKIINRSLAALELSVNALKNGNKKLGVEIQNLASRPAPAPIVMQASLAPASHVQQAVEDTRSTAAAEPRQLPNLKRTTKKTDPKPVATKNAAEKTEVVMNRRPKPVVQTVASQRTLRPRVKKELKQEQPEAPIVRAGPGWVEVVDVLDRNDIAAISVAPVKRGRGGPRKDEGKAAVVTPSKRPRRTIKQLDESPESSAVPAPIARDSKHAPGLGMLNEGTEAEYRKPPSRSLRSQAAKDPPASKKRNAAAAFIHENESLQVPETPRKNKQLRRGLTNIFSSPISSPSKLADEADVKPLDLSAATVQRPAPPRKRRTIKQDDDSD